MVITSLRTVKSRRRRGPNRFRIHLEFAAWRRFGIMLLLEMFRGCFVLDSVRLDAELFRQSRATAALDENHHDDAVSDLPVGRNLGW